MNRRIEEKWRELKNYRWRIWALKSYEGKKKINAIILRFFNVCSSLKVKNKIIGEFHNPETHLIPTVVYKNLSNQIIYIYGDDYKTKDGSCVRDYIHIKDICNAIKKSIDYLITKKSNFEIMFAIWKNS